MAYKGNHYTINNCFHFNDQLKDFLLACGWQLVGPTDTEPHRIAQDDKHARILGWFLQSNGEDGNKDLHMHITSGYDYADRGHTWFYDWLTSGITDSQTDLIPLQDATGIAAGAVVEINGEQIQVGSVDTSGSPHYLNGCTRGYGPTTQAAHDAGDVVSLLFNNGVNYLRSYIDMYVYRDLVNPIAQSSGAIGWTLGQTNNADPITGLDGYDSSGRTFKYTALIKAVGGSEDGKMRWVVNDDGAGRYTWTKFKTAPGAVDAAMISTGWHPAAGSRNQIFGAYADYKSSSPYGGPTYAVVTPSDAWFYGSKDGVAVVYKVGTTYRVYYWGAYVPFASPLTTTADGDGIGGDISAGATTIYVGDTNLFAEGGKYRIISQDYRDWDDNWDRSADTSMGASPGNWPDLEADESPQECVIVTGVNPGSGYITIAAPLIYSYRAGAVIGEDPRPVLSYCNKNGTSTARTMFDAAAADMGCRVPLHAADKARYRVDRPCHRRRDRCHDADNGTWSPWAADGGRDQYGGMDHCRPFMKAFSDTVLNNQENYTDKLLLTPFSCGQDDGYDRTGYGSEYRAYGIVPIVRDMSNSLGASDEDTVKVPWNGAMENFRIFYEDEGTRWMCLGPELWP